MFRMVAALLFVLGAGLAASNAGAQTDPQYLVGEWWGSWENVRVPAQFNGQYHLTIEKVEGQKVFGKYRTSGRQISEGSFVGTFDGSRLTFGRDPKVELSVVRDAMAGERTGTGAHATSKITLSKQK